MKSLKSVSILGLIVALGAGCAHQERPIGYEIKSGKGKGQESSASDDSSEPAAITSDAGRSSSTSLNAERAFEVYELIRNAAFSSLQEAINSGQELNDAIRVSRQKAKTVVDSLIKGHRLAVLQALYAMGDSEFLDAIYQGNAEAEAADLASILEDPSMKTGEFLAMVHVALADAEKESTEALVEIEKQMASLETPQGEVQITSGSEVGPSRAEFLDSLRQKAANHSLRLTEVSFLLKTAQDALDYMVTRRECAIEAIEASKQPTVEPQD